MKSYQPQQVLFEINCVDLKSLQKVFASFDSWNDLNDENSDFVNFLKEVCHVKGIETTLNEFE